MLSLREKALLQPGQWKSRRRVCVISCRRKCARLTNEAEHPGTSQWNLRAESCPRKAGMMELSSLTMTRGRISSRWNRSLKVGQRK